MRAVFELFMEDQPIEKEELLELFFSRDPQPGYLTPGFAATDSVVALVKGGYIRHRESQHWGGKLVYVLTDAGAEVMALRPTD